MLTGKPARVVDQVASLNGQWFDAYAFRVGAPGDGTFAMLFTNVTARHVAEGALSESEARFRALAKATSDVIYRMSADWTKMLTLQGRDFLADSETNETWLDNYIHSEDQAHVTAVIQSAIRTKTVFFLEHRVRRVDGTSGWTSSRAIPILDASGEITEWFGAAADITQRKQLEEERDDLLTSERAARHACEAANHAKDIFLATLSHELRTPLTADPCLGGAAPRRSG